MQRICGDGIPTEAAEKPARSHGHIRAVKLIVKHPQCNHYNSGAKQDKAAGPDRLGDRKERVPYKPEHYAYNTGADKTQGKVPNGKIPTKIVTRDGSQDGLRDCRQGA